MYITMIKKEFKELLRTKKVLIIGVIFTFFGFLSPITAKLMPDMMKVILPELNNITIPDATYIDSWGQFFKNVTQMGLIAMFIIFAGIVVNEITKGTLINLLTKGLTRKVVIVSKSIMLVIIFTIGITLSMIITAFYNFVLFENIISIKDIYAVGLVIIFFILLVCLIMFISAFAKSTYTVLLLSALFIATLLTINIVPIISEYNPITLLTCNLNIINGTLEISKTIPVVIVSIILSVTLFISSIMIFNKREI